MDSAVIFDVDGVLLDLTGPEEDIFFLAFEQLYGLTGLSRDWDSYQVRNDEHIIAEILERHGLPADDKDKVVTRYLDLLSSSIEAGEVVPEPLEGASLLLERLSTGRQLGIATANLLTAARLRLAHCGLWEPVSSLAFGAENSGHKRQTVAAAISRTGLPKGRIVYIGDNLNDVDAGLANGVHFIGYANDPGRRARLAAAGARHLCGTHEQTWHLIQELLG